MEKRFWVSVLGFREKIRLPAGRFYRVWGRGQAFRAESAAPLIRDGFGKLVTRSTAETLKEHQVGDAGDHLHLFGGKRQAT